MIKSTSTPFRRFYTAVAVGETEISATSEEDALNIATLYFETRNSLDIVIKETTEQNPQELVN